MFFNEKVRRFNVVKYRIFVKHLTPLCIVLAMNQRFFVFTKIKTGWFFKIDIVSSFPIIICWTFLAQIRFGRENRSVVRRCLSNRHEKEGWFIHFLSLQLYMSLVVYPTVENLFSFSPSRTFIWIVCYNLLKTFA